MSTSNADQRTMAIEQPTTRRITLVRAASGLLLAASGLILPRGVEEAAAEKPAHRLNRRSETRKKRRRNTNRNKKRSRQNGNRSQQKRNPGAPETRRGIRFGVELYGNDGESKKVEFYRNVDASSAGPNGTFELVKTAIVPIGTIPTNFEDPAVLSYLWIDDEVYVEVHNPFVILPTARMGSGGSIVSDESGTNYWKGGVTNIDQGMSQNECVYGAFSSGGFKYLLCREDDSDDYKEFLVSISR